MSAIRVVVADDHPMFLFGLVAALGTLPDIEVVGEASTGAELVALARVREPDVVLTDLAMPDLDGAAAARQLLAERPDLAVLVLSMHDDDSSLLAALQAGARGYLVKGSDRDEIARAVRAVAAGDAVYGAAVASRIVALAAGRRPTALRDLTPRERAVLEAMARGLRTSQIALELGMAEKTVRNHVSAVLMKLQVTDRTAAVLKAKEAGL